MPSSTFFSLRSTAAQLFKGPQHFQSHSRTGFTFTFAKDMQCMRGSQNRQKVWPYYWLSGKKTILWENFIQQLLNHDSENYCKNILQEGYFYSNVNFAASKLLQFVHRVWNCFTNLVEDEQCESFLCNRWYLRPEVHKSYERLKEWKIWFCTDTTIPRISAHGESLQSVDIRGLWRIKVEERDWKISGNAALCFLFLFLIKKKQNKNENERLKD